MSIYSELLAASLEVVGPADDGVERADLEAALVRELIDCRRRLPGGRRPGAYGEPTPPSDPPGDIARQIDYDLALIRLCRLLGIECDPHRFTRPLAERHRLEHALGGYDVGLEGVR